MEMHQLRYFVAVVQTGNFSRAAERCHVSQPSLSQQIQKLERGLGQQLLQRLGRRSVPTDAGRLLLDRALTILASAEDAERRLRGGQNADEGRLAIGAIPTIAPYVLPATLHSFAREFPRAELIVREDVTSQLVPAVVEGELDLAIVALPIDDPQVQAEPLLTEPLLLSLPANHSLAKRRRVTVGDLASERFILLGEMHCLGDQVLSFCKAHECQPRIACRSAQISTVQQLIALEQGISLLPQMACGPLVPDANRGRRGLVYRELAGDQPQRTIGAIWHRHYFHSSLAERYLGELRDWAGRQSANAKR
jgi:DNA-binding transcriptional LysR family regulator